MSETLKSFFTFDVPLEIGGNGMDVDNPEFCRFRTFLLFLWFGYPKLVGDLLS